MHTVIAFDHFPEDRFGRRTENRTADEFPPLGSIIDIDPFAPEVFDKFRIVFRIIFHCIKSKGKTGQSKTFPDPVGNKSAFMLRFAGILTSVFTVPGQSETVIVIGIDRCHTGEQNTRFAGVFPVAGQQISL